MSIIIVLCSDTPYSSVLKVNNNLFDKLESLNQGWVMSHVVRDVKLLESPFPRGSRREWMQFCCWPQWRDSFKVYKVIMGIKVILVNKNIIAGIKNSFNGGFKMNLVIKLSELMLFH